MNDLCQTNQSLILSKTLLDELLEGALVFLVTVRVPPPGRVESDRGLPFLDA